jgi:hypothetical protein
MRVIPIKEWKALYEAWRIGKEGWPSRVRGQIARGCRGKMRYESREEAIPIAKALPSREGLRVSVYACGICRGYHIGNTRFNRSEPNDLTPLEATA